jgi:hypothetical protein
MAMAKASTSWVLHRRAPRPAGVEELRPDVVLVDINVAWDSGFDPAELIAESPASGFVAKSELSADAICLTCC